MRDATGVGGGLHEQEGGRQEAAAGVWALLEASWATRGSSGIAGCGGVWGQAGGDSAVTASLEANCVSTRQAGGGN